MELRFKKRNKTIIIMISGEIDHHTAKEIRRQTENALLEMRGKNIIFGFEKVTFMDSSGIGMLIGRYKQLHVVGGRIAVACANDTIQELIQLSGISKLIPIYDSIEKCLSYIEGREENAV